MKLRPYSTAAEVTWVFPEEGGRREEGVPPYRWRVGMGGVGVVVADRGSVFGPWPGQTLKAESGHSQPYPSLQLCVRLPAAAQRELLFWDDAGGISRYTHTPPPLPQ